MLLGHQSVQTTERYLGTKQDLVNAPNDWIKLRVGSVTLDGHIPDVAAEPRSSGFGSNHALTAASSFRSASVRIRALSAAAIIARAAFARRV